MKHYSKKRKDAVLKRMMQPENAPVPMLAEETGISKVTGTPGRLYDWIWRIVFRFEDGNAYVVNYEDYH